jgi:hypothetical protein
LALKLPPLILHPFADRTAAGIIADGARAGFMLNGALPRDGHTSEELERQFLDARYCEFRMLFYVGKDVERWLEQCAEFIEHAPGAPAGCGRESFASLLIDAAPPAVREKLGKWGVQEYRNIFIRALGIRAVFRELPDCGVLGTEFLRYYYDFADHLFACREELNACRHPAPGEFDFELYASGEYSKLLEREWER